MSVKKDRLKRVTDKKDKKKRMRCGYELAGMRLGNGRGEKAIRIPEPGSKMSNNEVWNIWTRNTEKKIIQKKKINKEKMEEKKKEEKKRDLDPDRPRRAHRSGDHNVRLNYDVFLPPFILFS